jgi:GDP-L-fucose synthase
VGHGRIELWGTGEASREFLYVDDCAEFISLACSADTLAYPFPINIGTGVEIKIKHLVAMIAKIMGYTGDIVYNSEYPDGQPRRCLDTRLSKEIFGIEARTDLYKGLQKTISWYYANKDKEKFSGYFNSIQ